MDSIRASAARRQGRVLRAVVAERPTARIRHRLMLRFATDDDKRSEMNEDSRLAARVQVSIRSLLVSDHLGILPGEGTGR